MKAKAKAIISWAIGCRCVVWFLGCMSSLFIKPYDTSMQLDQYATSSVLVRSFAHWDAVHFVKIAQVGYEYEHSHAFFPLFPLLMRGLSTLLTPVLEGSWSNEEIVMLSGLLISNTCTVAAAYWLFQLGVLVLKNQRLAFRAAIIFCISPASIFLTAIYSESLTCALTFAGMYFFERHRILQTRSVSPALIICSLLFGASSLARSNSNILSLFIAYHRVKVSPHPVSTPLSFIYYWLITAVLGLIAIGPQVAYFLYGIAIYCPSLDRPWCSQTIPNISAMYMFIQREYWNVGPFRYYELKQLPNFLLAAPMIVLSLHGLRAYFITRREEYRSLDLHRYMCHWGFLLVNGIVVAHIQIITRLLSVCPAVYWSAAVFCSGKSYSKWLALYCIVFNILGCCMFCNFYPWT